MTRRLKILLCGLVVAVPLIAIVVVPRKDVLSLFAFLGVSLAVTTSVTALICRCWLLCQKRVSFVTALFGWVISGLLTTSIVLLYSEGWDAFTRAYWSEETGVKGGFMMLYIILVFVGAMCMLPALLVMVYYQRSNAIKPA